MLLSGNLKQAERVPLQTRLAWNSCAKDMPKSFSLPSTPITQVFSVITKPTARSKCLQTLHNRQFDARNRVEDCPADRSNLIAKSDGRRRGCGRQSHNISSGHCETG